MVTFHGSGTFGAWAELGTGSGGGRHTGARSKQLPPLSDKERFVVFSLFAPNIRVNLPSPFSVLCLLFLFFSPWPLIRDWICWSNDRGRKRSKAQVGVGGDTGDGAGVRCGRPGLSTVLSVSPDLRHPWPVLALESQRLAFSLDSHHGLSVRRAQSQQPRPTDHRRGRDGCRLKSCLDAAQGTMESCIFPQITQATLWVSSGRIETSDPSVLSSRITSICFSSILNSPIKQFVLQIKQGLDSITCLGIVSSLQQNIPSLAQIELNILHDWKQELETEHLNDHMMLFIANHSETN